MKQKIIFILAFFLCIVTFAQENKFNVLVHNRTHLKTREEYSKKVLFPIKDKQIKDITLDFSLNCPEHKCSDWDYSINILLRKVQGKDTLNFQLGRMITPYSGWYNQGAKASTWDYHLKWNITEYLPLMTDSVDIVISFEGYQDGFLASTDFIFTEYNPKEKPTDFIGVENVYLGYYPFGREDSTIDDFLPKRTIVVPNGTKKVLARMTVSGHGGDGLNAAAEFLEKSYYYRVNDNLVAKQSIWRDDCGCNPVQPQGGTWIYNRAGWCPGTKVNEYYYDLTPYIKDKKLNIDLSFDYYNGHNSGDAGYQIANDLFFIKDKEYKHNEIEDIREFYLRPIALPTEFILVFKTNADARDKWFIAKTERDNNAKLGFVAGKKYYEQTQFDTEKIYTHRIKLQEGDSCLFKVEDTDCDGLSWWANPMQKDGYILIYDKDSTNVLHAFEPDFGCFINQPFIVTDDKFVLQHRENKLVTLQDKDKKELRILFFCQLNFEEKMEVVIKNRKTGEQVYNKTFDAKNRHDVTIDYKDFAEGYYSAYISCNGHSEYKMFINRDKQ